MKLRALLSVATLSLATVSLAACARGELTPPPPPLRPEAEPALASKPVAKDCDPVQPADELKPIAFNQRSIPEGQKLADQARAELKAAGTAEVDRPTREAYITDAVEHLITALRADPYNVSATYSLAGAYARIGRKQCSLNLLQRVLQMRTHASKHAEVEAQLDRLLGRRQVLDPDFAEMRDDTRFRMLIRKMCEGTTDANCVYGGQKDNRER